MSSRKHRWMLVSIAVMMLGASVASAAYDQQYQQRDQQQYQGYGRQNQWTSPSQRQGSMPQRGMQSGATQSRNQQLERQVAGELRQQGFGQEGQILILATGNELILLGAVPDQNTKQRAEQIAQQVSGVQQVDNRLQVLRSTARRQNDSQLEQSTQQRLQRTGAAQNIQTQANNGRVTLSGQVNSWQDMADAIEAAFVAGAQRVDSQLQVSGQQMQYGQQQYSEQYGRQYGQDRFGAQQDQYGAQYGQPYGQSYDQYGQDRYSAQRDQWDQDSQWQRTDQYGQYDQSTGRGTQQFGRTTLMQQRLEAQLRNQVQGGESISVLLAQDKAYLFGRVQNEDAKEQAERILQQSARIDDIENKIIVSEEGWERQNDAEIQEEIQSEMRWSPFVDGESIRISVSNGVASLSGQVDDIDAAASVIENAFEGGARAIRNQLQITGQMTARGQESEFDTDRGYYPPYGYTPGDRERENEFPWQQDSRQWDQQRDTRTQQWDQQPQWDRQPQSRQPWDQQQYGQQRGTTGQQWERQQQWQRTGQQAGTRQQISASDMALAHRIALQLQQQLQTDKTVHVMNPQAIYIHVSQGTVMLHGFVQDNDQKQQAQQIAQSIRGVQNVRNELKVFGETTDYQTFGYVPGQSSQDQSQDRSRQGQMGGTQDSSQQDRSGSTWNQSQSDQTDSSQTQGRSGQSGSTSNQSQASQAGSSQSQSQAGQSSSQQMTSTDRQLAQQIEQKLKEQSPGTQVNVSVSNGTATLQGSVQSESQKQQIEQIAKTVSGVRNVQNNLTVSSRQSSEQQSRSGSQSQSGQSSRLDQYTSQSQSAQSGTRSQSQSGQSAGVSQPMSASDRQLAQQIEQKLQQQLSDAKIDVTISQGTATLKGSVQDDQQKQQAEQIAKSTRGVQDIRNEISVSGQEDYQVFGYVPGQPQSRQGSRSDTLVAHQIALQLQQQFSDQVIHVMDPEAIYVMVSEGTVMLHGSVQDNNQKQQAGQIIQNVRGVQNVRNELQVQGQQQSFSRQQQTTQRTQQPYGQQTDQWSQQQTDQQRQQMTASDRRLAQQVEQRFATQLSQANIHVMVNQGTVTLHGSVQDQNQKQQAERIARAIEGVRNVQNQLTVAREGAEYPPLGYIPGQPGQQPPDTDVSGDEQCVQLFKQQLTSQNLVSSARDTYVTCHEGKMALYGYVSSEGAKEQLVRVTKEIQGIEEVDDNLTVRESGWEQKSDTELQEDVESQLWWSPFVDSDKIRVTVQNGIVTLSGEADDWDAMRAAVKNAFDAGARRVRSQIRYPAQAGQRQSGSQPQPSGDRPTQRQQSTEQQSPRM